MAVDSGHIVYVGRLDGCVVYVGEGKVGRENHLNSGVSHVYEANQAHFSGVEVDVEILYEDLSKSEAVAEEKRLILSLQPAWNKTLTERSKLVRRFNLALQGAENVLHVNNKLALFYACKDNITSEGVAVVRARDVDALGGKMRMVLKMYNKKTKPQKVYEISTVSKGVYEVRFKQEWLRHLEYHIAHLIKLAERRNG